MNISTDIQKIHKTKFHVIINMNDIAQNRHWGNIKFEIMMIIKFESLSL